MRPSSVPRPKPTWFDWHVVAGIAWSMVHPALHPY